MTVPEAEKTAYLQKQKELDDLLQQQVVAAGPGYFIKDYEWINNYHMLGWNTYNFITWIFREQWVEWDETDIVTSAGIDDQLAKDLTKAGFPINSPLIFTLADGTKLKLEALSFNYEEGKPVWWDHNLSDGGWSRLHPGWDGPVRIMVNTPTGDTITAYPDYQMGGWDYDFRELTPNQSINYRQLKI